MMTSEYKSSKIRKIGKVVGFGASYMIFTSIFFLLLSYTHRIPEFVQYWEVVAAVATSYILGFLAIGRKKWKI